MIPYNNNLKELAKRLRNNQTEAEKVLWKRLQLKHLGLTFYRQKPIGDYIVDFYCPKAYLVVEVDGGKHFTLEMASNDSLRSEHLNSLGLKILRFSNSEVITNTDRVTEIIFKAINKSSFTPPFKKGDKRLK